MLSVMSDCSPMCLVVLTKFPVSQVLFQLYLYFRLVGMLVCPDWSYNAVLVCWVWTEHSLGKSWGKHRGSRFNGMAGKQRFTYVTRWFSKYFVPLSVQISLRKEVLYEICLKYTLLLVDNSCDCSTFL